MATQTAVTEKELIHLRVENGIAVIEMDDPPANTYTYTMMRQLDDAILQARMDDEAHVIILRGAGEKFFSAGAEIKMLSEAVPGWKYCFCLHANETLCRLEQTPKLVLAALNGHTVGGGLEKIAEMIADQQAQPGFRVAGSRAQLLFQPREQGGETMLLNQIQQLFLAVKVVVEPGQGNPAAAGEVANAGPFVSLFAKDARGTA